MSVRRHDWPGLVVDRESQTERRSDRAIVRLAGVRGKPIDLPLPDPDRRLEVGAEVVVRVEVLREALSPNERARCLEASR